MSTFVLWFYVSEVSTKAPEIFRTPLQKKVYQALAALDIPFECVDTEEAITMEDWMDVSDGTTTGYMKIGTERIIRDFLPYAKKSLQIIEI